MRVGYGVFVKVDCLIDQRRGIETSTCYLYAVNRHPGRWTRVAIIVTVIGTVVIPATTPAAHASGLQVSLSKKCNNAADITDNGRDVWMLCQGLSSSESNIIEIDVNSGEVVTDIASPSSIALPDEITSNGTYVWIKDSIGSGTAIAQFATPSGRLVRVLSDPAIPVTEPEAIAATANSLWIADGGERHLVQVSAATGLVTHVGAALEFDQPSSIATSGDDVWVLDQKQSLTVANQFIYTVTEFSATGAIVRVVTLDTYNAKTGRSVGIVSLPESLAATPSGVWVDSSEPEAIEISARSGHVLHRFKNLPYFGQKNGPHLVVASGTHLWVAAPNPAVYEFNANTGHLTNTSDSTGTFTSFGFYGIAADSKYVWVMNSSLGQLAEFRRSNDALVRDYS